MKCSVSEALLICLLCLLELFKVSSSDQRPMDIIDNFIGLAEPNNNEIEKRNSIVDGGVFVPYKSTTIVYKSRLVPVTYGFVIKKETLKDNPALYKLGVKLLDEKVQSTPKQIQLDGKKVEPPNMLTENHAKLNEHQQLDAKSNCVKGSKLLRLLDKLSKDINKIEKTILAQNQSVESEQEEFIAKSLKKNKARQKAHPQNEAHVSGHKGVFEKELNIKKKKPQNRYISKNLSRYWQCRRSHTKTKCAMLLFTKHVHRGQYHKHPERHQTAHYNKHNAKHKKHEGNVRQYLKKHKYNRHEMQDKYNMENTTSPVKHDESKHKSNRQHKDKYNTEMTVHPVTYEHHQKHHRKHHRKYRVKPKSYASKHLFRHNSNKGEQLYNNDPKSHPIGESYRRRNKKVVRKKKRSRKQKMHEGLKHRHSLRRHNSWRNVKTDRAIQHKRTVQS